MKRGLLITSLILGTLPPATAGGVFYNSNQSAEYFRTFDRNSAIDNADIVYYNMAGTVKLREGWTFNLSNQTIFQKATVETKGNPVVGNRKYESNNPVWSVPNLYAAYRKTNWSLFLGLETIGATAVRDWKDGLPTLDLAGKQAAGYGSELNSRIIGLDAAAHGQDPILAALDASHYTATSRLKGSSYYLAFRHGGAYQFNDYFSMAIAGRLVIAQQDIVGSVDSACTYNQYGHDLRTQKRLVLDTSDKATGYSGEIGLNLYPTKGMVINLTYEMSTPLNFKTTVHDGKDGGGLATNGKKARLDLPQVVRFGLGYQVTPAVRVSMGANAYLEKNVDFSMLDNPANQNDHTKDYRNTYEECASIEYRASKAWLWSIGFNWNQIGQRKSSTIDTSIPGAHANYMSIGTGFQYEYSEKVKFNFGIGHTRFASTYENADVMGDQALKANFAANGVTIDPRKEYDKKYIVVALGVDYRF